MWHYINLIFIENINLTLICHKLFQSHFKTFNMPNILTMTTVPFLTFAIDQQFFPVFWWLGTIL